jgi:hypothetical protein
MMLFLVLKPRERPNFYKAMATQAKKLVDETMDFVEQALKGNLAPLMEHMGGEFPLKSVLSIFGVKAETASLIMKFMVGWCRDCLRSCGFRGKRYVLVVHPKGAKFSRRKGTHVIVRAPVISSGGVYTVILNPVVLEGMKHGYFIVADADPFFGDDDGDFVALFDDPILLKYSRKLERIDHIFKVVKKEEKVPRFFPTTIEGFWAAARAGQTNIGRSCMGLFFHVLRWAGLIVEGTEEERSQAQAELERWCKQCQIDVDRIKRDAPADWVDPESPRAPGLFPWRAEPRNLLDFHDLPLSDAEQAMEDLPQEERESLIALLCTDPIYLVWNTIAPHVGGLGYKAQQAAKPLGPMEVAMHIKPELIGEIGEVHYQIAADARSNWAISWRELHQKYGDEIPAEEADCVNAEFVEWINLQPTEVRTALIMGDSSLSMKNLAIKGQWTDYCTPQENCNPILRGSVSLQPEVPVSCNDDGLIVIGDSDRAVTNAAPLQVRFQNVQGGVLVSLQQNIEGKHRIVYLGRAIKRIGKVGKGAFVHPVWDGETLTLFK